MIDWGPLTVLALVMLAIVLPLLIFGWRYVRLPRLLLAVVVTAIFQFAVLFACSGFGWGWPDPSQSALLLGRISLGVSMGISGSLFAWILSRRFNFKISTVLVLGIVAIMIPDAVRSVDIQFPLAGLALFSSLCFWFRERRVEGPDREGNKRVT